MIDQTTNFLMKGFAKFEVPNLIDLSTFNITNVELDDNLENNFSNDEETKLKAFIEYVSENFVRPLYNNFEIVYYAVWDGVDEGSMGWHNDAVEGFDFNVLYYFDDTDPSVGGCIEFKWPGGEELIYPKSGDLIFINQNGKFFHKASRSKSHRRVASIEYKIYE